MEHKQAENVKRVDEATDSVKGQFATGRFMTGWRLHVFRGVKVIARPYCDTLVAMCVHDESLCERCDSQFVFPNLQRLLLHNIRYATHGSV